MLDLTDVSLGMWVDLPRKMVLTEEFFAWFCEELRFDMMAIMIDDSDKAVEFSYGPKDVEKALELADKYALEIGLTTWPYPVKELLDQMALKMLELLKVGPIAEWETDQEFNWGEDDVSGFKGVRTEEENEDGVIVITNKTPYDAAGDYLVDIKRRVCKTQDARNAMTTFTMHRELSARADVAGEGDIVLAQGYSTDERDGKPIHFDHIYGPGRMQNLTLDRALKIPGAVEGKVEVGIGHAAWNQESFNRKVNGKWIIEDPEVAMMVALQVALAHPSKPRDHRWWSAKFCYPKSRRYLEYAERFLRGLRAGQ